MTHTAEKLPKSYTGMWNYRKYLLRKRESCTGVWTEDGRSFKCILVPQVLQDFMIILAHDHSGQSGSRRTYSCLKKTILLARYLETGVSTL